MNSRRRQGRDHDLKRGLGRAFGVRTSPVRPAARWADTNLGGSGLLREELRHIFPDSWAFFLGEIAMYCFIILVATGIFLALFFQASEAPVVYDGSYAPLAGAEMSIAYDSALQLSLDVPAGLLVRQVHHWAALVFVGALIIHMLRMLLTAAYRRPRRLNFLIGASLVLLVGMNGLMGYSLPDDLLSGTGLRIAFSITESIPFVGPAAASLHLRRRVPVRAASSPASTRCTSSCCRRRSAVCSARTSGCCGCSGTRSSRGRGGATAPSSARRWCRPTPCAPPATSCWSPASAPRSAPSCRSTRCGSTARTAPGTRPRRPSPTGTWAGSRARCG